MDAFYASVEQRDAPEYRQKPIAVGGSPTGRGGVVATASYEARKFGVHSAMPSKTAQRLCPDIIFVYPRFDVYKNISRKIREIFQDYTDLVEPLSLDEAYLDVSIDKKGIGSALDIAGQIKQRIKEELQLTASAGVSVNKFVAKVASGMNKPDGLTFIGPSKVESFIEQLPVQRFFGVGKVTAAKMESLGLYTGKDIKRLPEKELTAHFGKAGKFYYQVVRGIDNRPVRPHREAKSLSVEDTFQEDLTTKSSMLLELNALAERLLTRLEKTGLQGSTITLKFKFHNFSIITRSLTLDNYTNEKVNILEAINHILALAPVEGKRVRLLGIGMANFQQGSTRAEKRGHDVVQLEIFPGYLSG